MSEDERSRGKGGAGFGGGCDAAMDGRNAGIPAVVVCERDGEESRGLGDEKQGGCWCEGNELAEKRGERVAL